MFALVNRQVIPRLIGFMAIFETTTKFDIPQVSLNVFLEAPSVSECRLAAFKCALIDLCAIQVSKTVLSEMSF